MHKSNKDVKEMGE